MPIDEFSVYLALDSYAEVLACLAGSRGVW
jgi:hypothetical protein